jgi:vacuolar-type H+-ATPase subunit C/Vma6
MITAAGFAFGNARVRAMRSKLLRPEDGFALRAGTSLAALAAALGAAPQASARLLRLELFVGLVRDYGRVAASYPRGATLFQALLGLHEIENWKILWRALVRRVPEARWAPLWRPLGRLETLRLDDALSAASLFEAAVLSRNTAYEDVTAEALRAPDGDLGAAERIFDRFATRRLAEEARRLPRRERAARELALAVVRERDARARRHAAAAGGSPEEIRLAAAVFTEESSADGSALPDLSRMRRKACRSAFLGPPLTLGPAVAYLLLKEEEVRAVGALAEACGLRPPAGALDRALAGSALALSG